MSGGEFTCCECGMRIWNALGFVPAPALCGICLHLPGWQDVEELHARLDPWWGHEEARLLELELERWADDGGAVDGRQPR